MTRLLLAALLLAPYLALAGCASQAPAIDAAAAPPAACMRWEQVRALIPPGVTVATVDDPQAFLAAFNALPPATNVTADELRVARAGRVGHVWFLTAGCVTDHWMMPWEAVSALLGVPS
jgi:hypothetical protein